MKPVVLSLLVLLVAFLPACDPANRPPDGPVLLSDVTIEASAPVTQRELSATPAPIMIPVLTSTLDTLLGVEQPVVIATNAAQFLLVTPTLPPSKTPTNTPTFTASPTLTRTLLPPSATVAPATATPFALFEAPTVLPPTAFSAGVVPLPTALPPTQGQTCQYLWFFTNFFPANCPTNPPVASAAAFQQFQTGLMLWIGQQDAIYVLYDSANYPRWQVFQDLFSDGMPESDPNFNNPPTGLFQPRRGIGLVWRSQAAVVGRLGWAVMPSEQAFSASVQLGADGTVYINDPRGGVFVLTPNGADWQRYA